MNHKRGFTLIEIMVVVAIIALLAVLVVPSLRAMQSANARSQAYNTINAALMAARSYAIMNGVTTAARFQPNGKIFLVYKVKEGTQACDWAGNVIQYPGNGRPNANNIIFLPVVDQEPLQMPHGYAVADARPQNQRRPFFEPFYICYNSDGTLAVNEQIWVALIEDQANRNPVSLNVTGDNRFAWWDPNTVFNSSTWDQWVIDSEDPNRVGDPADRALSRFYNVAASVARLETILKEDRNGEDPDYGPDHYGGAFLANYTPPGYSVQIDLNFTADPTTQLAIFKTPENWDQMKLFSTTAGEKTKQLYVDDATTGILAQTGTGTQTKEDSFDRMFLNAYTGRIIRPVE